MKSDSSPWATAVGHNGTMNPSPRRTNGGWLGWLGSHELGLLLALAGIAAGVWAFTGIAGEVVEGDTQHFDRRILLAMRRPGDLAPLGPAWLQATALDITSLGSVTVLGLVTMATCGFLALDGRKHMALFIGAAVTGGAVAGEILKSLFQRPRPELVPHEVYVSSSSFPSGHSMMSAVVYLTLGSLLARTRGRKSLKAYILLLAAFLCLIVGVSRVYLGVHWPTDVLAGWTAGAVWALACGLAARWLQKREALEPEAPPEAPAPPYPGTL